VKRHRVSLGSRRTITVTLTRPQPDTTVCTTIGEIDMDTTPALRDALAEARGDDNAHCDKPIRCHVDGFGWFVWFRLAMVSRE
jgi:hypothetical protein